ncbi:cysteine-rich venom protein [Labrus bergylta]|uniref:cysteine-rich venom protein n=1 Tax=Labrus bergylta TaxID=56723 RepID=UPI003313C6BE
MKNSSLFKCTPLRSASTVCPQQNICTEYKAVQNEIVDLHNAFRRAVQPTASNMLMMIHSEDLRVNSQAWVDQCILAHGKPSNRLLDGYECGENMFYSAVPYSWTEVINAWHAEVQLYQYPEGATNLTGHYTQVVWFSSYKVGCGVALCNDVYLYACQYYRAGNFMNSEPYKFGTPCASCPKDCVDNLCTNPCPYTNKYRDCPSPTEVTVCEQQLSEDCPASCKCPNKIIPKY